MAVMTQAQITAELVRKAAEGKKPTSTANQTQYDAIIKSQNAAPTTPNNTINKTPTNGNMGISGIDPAAVAAHQQAAEAFKNANWGPNGTANGMTGNQNLAAVIQQSGGNSINGTTATPYINSKGETDYHITGQPDTVQASTDQPSLGSQLTELASNGSSNNVSNNANTQVAAAPQANGNSLIQSIYDSMYASQAQKLKAARDSQLAGLAGQDDLAKQNAKNSLNANDASGARLAQQLKESMANAGLGSSGDYISAQVGQNTGQQQNANTINQDMSNKLQQLLAQKDSINNNASADDLALLQSIQSQMAQAQMNQSNSDRSYGLDLAGLTGNINGQQTLASRNADRGYGLDLAGLTGNIGGQQTLASQSLGLQAQNQGFNQNLQTNQYNQDVNNTKFNQNLQTKQLERSNFESDRSYQLAKSSQDWNQTFQKEQYSDQKAQQIWDNTFKDKSFTQSMADAAASRGLQWANLNQNDKEFLANQTFREKSFTADQEQRKLDNTYRDNQSGNKPKVDPKLSAEAYAHYKSEVDNSSYSKSQKLAFAESIKDEMTDSDYANFVKGIE